VLKYALAYIKEITYYSLIYQDGGDLNPVGYVNSDYASCKNMYQSIEGNIFMVAGDLVLWKSK